LRRRDHVWKRRRRRRRIEKRAGKRREKIQLSKLTQGVVYSDGSECKLLAGKVQRASLLHGPACSCGMPQGHTLLDLTARLSSCPLPLLREDGKRSSSRYYYYH
jgi:hypothetical protein